MLNFLLLKPLAVLDWVLYVIFSLFSLFIPEFFRIVLIKAAVFLKIYYLGFVSCLKQFCYWRKLSLLPSTLTPLGDRQPLAIVTGGTSGIGLALCERLAPNWRLIVIGRDRRKGHSAVEHLKRRCGGRCKVIFYMVDLSSRKSINAFLDTFLKTFDRLHLLVNNAAVMMTPYQPVGKSGDIELQWAVNFLAPIYLADRLSPRLETALKQDGFARVVNVSSVALYAASLSPEYFACAGGCNGSPNRYSSHLAYANSKLALSLFVELHAQSGKTEEIDKVLACSTHPGVVATDLYRYTNIFMRLLVGGFVPFVRGRFILNPEQAALDLLWVCLSPDVEPGAFYENGRRLALPTMKSYLKEALCRHLQRQDIISRSTSTH